MGSAGALQAGMRWENSRWRDSHAKKPFVEGSGKEGIQQVLMN